VLYEHWLSVVGKLDSHYSGVWLPEMMNFYVSCLIFRVSSVFFNSIAMLKQCTAIRNSFFCFPLRTVRRTPLVHTEVDHVYIPYINNLYIYIHTHILQYDFASHVRWVPSHHGMGDVRVVDKGKTSRYGEGSCEYIE